LPAEGAPRQGGADRQRKEVGPVWLGASARAQGALAPAKTASTNAPNIHSGLALMANESPGVRANGTGPTAEPDNLARPGISRMVEPVEIMLVILFPTRAPQSFEGFGDTPDGLEAIPGGDVSLRLAQVHEVERAVLGAAYLASRRLTRWPVGRVRLPPLPDSMGPSHGDLYLLTHTAGVALWECWLPVPVQPLDLDRLTDWLLPEGADSLVSVLRERISRIERQLSPPPSIEGAFPLTILRVPASQPSLDSLVAQYGADLVRLLYVDQSRLPFKPTAVADELKRDFCLREGGISLLSQRGALDLHTGEGFPTAAGASVVLPPRSALPLLVTIELLLVERGVLKLFSQRLSADIPGSVSRLLALKQDVLDGLEEYRGALATSNRFNREATAYGKEVLGLDDLYQALSDKLDGVTFEITTRYQQTTNLLQFWLTLLFTAVDAAVLATSLAIVHYGPNGAVVLPIAGWAIGTGLATAAAVALLLRRRLS